MAEYSEFNRFPFHSGNKSVATYTDDNEKLYEFDFILSKVVDRFPKLDPRPFYKEIDEIQMARERYRINKLKEATDRLFRSIKYCLMDEDFVHQLHDRWGLGIDKLIETLYAVYGYYFYTGKRTANAIKKIIDGYSRKPVH